MKKVYTSHIGNSDQGSHFTSPQYTQRWKAAGVSRATAYSRIASQSVLE